MDVHSFWNSLKIPIPKTTNHHFKSGFQQPTFLTAIFWDYPKVGFAEKVF